MAIERFEIDTDFLKKVRRELEACSNVIAYGMLYADPAYCKGAESAIAAIDALLAAAPRPEAGQQDGAVIDYGSIDQAPEFIQLFNAAFEALKHGHSIGICWDLMKAAKHELTKLAKRQPAPRPVPTSDFERGALTAIALIVRCHDEPTLACDVLKQMCLGYADCSGIDPYDAEMLAELCDGQTVKLTGLVRPAEPDGGAV